MSKLLQGRPRFITPTALAVIAGLFIFVLSALVSWSQRSRSYDMLEASVLGTAAQAAQHIESSFEHADALLQSVTQRYWRAHAEGPEAVGALFEDLKSELPNYHLVSRIVVTNAAGDVFYNTAYTPDSKRTNIADRAYFQRARAGDGDLLFSEPVQAKLDQLWSLVLARRLQTTEGAFAGVILVAYPIESIAKSMAVVNVGTNGLLSLRNSNFTQIARVPALDGPQQGIGNTHVSQTVKDLMAAHPDRDHHVYRTKAPTDSVERLYVVKKFSHYPFWIAVGRATEDFGSLWSWMAMLLFLMSGGVTVILLIWARRLERHGRTLEDSVLQRTEELNRQTQFLQTLAETLPGMVMYWDAGLRNRFANSRHLDWFGRSPQKIHGMSMRDVLGPDLYASVEPQVQAALRGEVQRFELPLTFRDGRVAHTLVSHVPDLQDGVVKGFFAVVMDISDLKEAYQRIAEQAHELDDLYNRAPCGYHALGPDGTILRINDTELEWLGCTREEVINRKRITDFLTPASQIAFQQNFAKLQAQGYIDEQELELIGKHGRLTPVLVSATVFWDEENRFHHTRSVLLDYSRMRSEQETLRRILTAAPMAVRIASLRDNRVLFMNQAFCDLTQQTEAQAREIDVRQFYVDPGVFDQIQSELSQGRSVSNQLVELHLPDKPQAPHVWALASFMVVQFMREPGILAWIFDVTKLHEAQKLAEQSDRFKSDFLATMSHEIRTPLNGVIGYLELLEDLDRQLPGPAPSYVQKSIDSARLLRLLLDDLLDFSKIEAGKLEIHHAPLSLDQLLESSAELIKGQVGVKPVQLRLKIAPELLGRSFVGDEQRIRQVVLNLLSNAVKFTEQGEVSMEASVVARDDAAWQVRVEVRDTGIGISSRQMDRLFKPFEQADGSISRRFGGSGLGLAISQSLLLLMGSTGMQVQSTVGQGSCFSFVLSLSSPPQLALESSAAEPVPDARLQAMPGLEILLVEDNLINIELVATLLKRMGMIVSIATSGQDALDCLEQFGSSIDLVLMDMQMPVMDGLTATRAIRANRTFDNLPIVAMTANAYESDRRACLDAGMNDFLAKPLDRKELLRVIRQWGGQVRTQGR